MSFGSTQLYNWSPTTQFPNFSAALSAVRAGTPGALCRIVFIGDSMTYGEVAQDPGWKTACFAYLTGSNLQTDGYANVSHANFDGGSPGGGSAPTGPADTRVALVSGAAWGTGAYVAGNNPVVTTNAGDGYTFTPTDATVTADHLDILWLDIFGGAAVDIYLDGSGTPISGSPFSVHSTGGFGNMITSISIPAGTHTSVTVLQNGATQCYLCGAAFWSHASPKVEVYSTGVPGTLTTYAGISGGTFNPNTVSGSDQWVGTVQHLPTLSIIDLGNNDMAVGVTVSDMAANITSMATTLQGLGSDVIIFVPQPYNGGNYGTDAPALYTALQTTSTTYNIPIVNFGSTYNYSESDLATAGYMYSDGLHFSGTGHADMAARIAALIEQISPSGGGSGVSSVNSIIILP